MTDNTLKFTVREAHPADFEAVIDSMADAFAADPVMSMAVGGAHKTQRLKELFRFQIETTYGPHGAIDLAETDDGKILGAALWIGPEAQKGSVLRDIRSLPEYAKILGGSFIRGIVTELRLLATRPKFDHWYLYTIGVHEDARSHGVGGELIKFRKERLNNTPAYLEASTLRSAALYQRMGFVELGEFKGGKPAVGMWLPPKKSQSDLKLAPKQP